MYRAVMYASASGNPSAHVKPVQCLSVVGLQDGFLTGSPAAPGTTGLIAATDELLAPRL
jgi:hypothetical protein